MASVSEVIVDTLLQAGARRCYGIVGDTINHFTDAVRCSEMAWVHVRHEEVGALAAGGESYLTQELSICAGTTGPGSLHFLNGIFESHRNGAPVVLIASNIDRREQGLQFPQEVDQRRLYEQCSVFCETISHPAQVRRITTMAAQAALNRRGVAVLVVNGDMFKAQTPDELVWRVHRPQPVTRPSDAELRDLVERLSAAKRITIFGGIGCRDAHDQVVALAGKLQAPVVHTTRAKEFLAYDNPCNVGMTGMLGNRAGYEAIAQCDLLLCLGTDFAYTEFYPEQAVVVQIDHDATHIGRRSPVDLGLVGVVSATLEVLLPLLENRGYRRFLDDCLARFEQDQTQLDERAEEPDETLIHPQFVARTLDRLAADDAAFTADGGSPMVWLLRHVRANGQRRFLTSLLHGTMANAYPQALGMALAYPHRQVIALTGDGGLSMLLGDLLTLVQASIPVKLLLFNNGSLGFVEMEQRVEGLLDSFTQLRNPDFAELARCCGLYGDRVERAHDLDPAMRRWLAHEGPALLDVTVNRMELVVPPSVTAGQLASSALFGVKAILNGRTDELVELIKDNIVR
ncbi:MAG: thiamine pyrophosphate-binding protein [Candidatus Thiodiazotropha sp.]